MSSWPCPQPPTASSSSWLPGCLHDKAYPFLLTGSEAEEDPATKGASLAAVTKSPSRPLQGGLRPGPCGPEEAQGMRHWKAIPRKGADLASSNQSSEGHQGLSSPLERGYAE